MPKRRKVSRPFKYKPVSVKDLLVEMKDISELMVDLAYSSILFKNKEIAEDVTELESRMDELNYRIRITAMLAARSVEDAERISAVLQFASASEKISNAAGDLSNIILRDMKIHPIVYEALEDAEEQIEKYEVSTKSKLAHMTLKKAELGSKIGTYIIAVKRKDTIKYNPSKGFVIKEGDLLIARGSNTGLEILKSICSGIKTKW
ncbi:MAG: TrkA-C domain protein [Candidatus Methanofastidiosum methylothiophilum]|uniref:TrkA-C domain protein n=1 Tax=Candidatus Methanofastidiosum methylothiophilum TaxID=1705564 RepID=A0A150ILB0_9EURY|nr:MAG: TrkA-C domain protein [Candidatus Methanofastidiosum methylthiophilus]KYC48047.1 MAG: TrkA-C domain protein [Candidatus Methanofastidiosum methylthiophilus]KYC50438.1 MAG: TrkA-C domain protein [Candidatus Methanofastidiosum methylthiophilus]